MKGLYLFLAAVPALAVPITINDGCFGTYSSGPNTGQACNANIAHRDVHGDLAMFDIQRIVLNQFDASALNFSIFTNFGNNATALNPFHVNDWLNIGDVLFLVDGTVKYGIPLQTRTSGQAGANGRKNTDPNNKLNPNGGTLTAGTLYQVNDGFAVDGKGLLKAKSVLANNAPSNYRPEEYVWLQSTDGSGAPGYQSTLTNLGFGSVSVSTLASNPHLRIDVNVPLVSIPGFYLDGTQGMTIHFAAATCANDIIEGQISAAVPEPSTIGMLSSGLIALAVAYRKRRKV